MELINQLGTLLIILLQAVGIGILAVFVLALILVAAFIVKIGIEELKKK